MRFSNLPSTCKSSLRIVLVALTIIPSIQSTAYLELCVDLGLTIPRPAVLWLACYRVTVLPAASILCGSGCVCWQRECVW